MKATFGKIDKDQIASLLTIGASPERDDDTVLVSMTTRVMDKSTSTSRPEIHGYRLIEVIGQGGGGTVWRAWQHNTQREVALKILAPGLETNQRAQIRFEREVELTSRLEHPCIARIYDSGVFQGQFFYVMELIEGVPLNRYVREKELSTDEIVALFLLILEGMQYAHQRGVIHRDLKPANILVSDDGRPHIVDFGLAKPLYGEDSGFTVSVEGDVLGTPAYMAPEQSSGRVDGIDVRTDIYSLGVIFYELLMQKLPYDATGSMLQVLQTINEQEVERPSKIQQGFDSDIEAVLIKALEKSPEDRYSGIADWVGDLTRWQNQLPVSARPITPSLILRKFIRRNKYACLVAALVFVVFTSSVFSIGYVFRELVQKETQNRATTDAVIKKAQREMAASDSFMLIAFLEEWAHNPTERLKSRIHFWNPGTAERSAIEFLLDERPVSEKEAVLRERVSGPQVWLASFVLAEHCRRDFDVSSAKEHYRVFLSVTEQGNIVTAPWFVNRAKSYLADSSTKAVCLIGVGREPEP